MKKLTYILIFFAFPMLGIGQTSTENYVKTTTYLVAIDSLQEDNVNTYNKIEQISYADGLGRPLQSVAARAGGNGEHIITHREYDALGRSPKQYLPYATTQQTGNDPLLYRDPIALKTDIEAFYNTPKYENTQNPYSEMRYEASPLNRVLEQGAPGNSWSIAAGHTIKLEYQVNQANEVRHFEVNFTSGNTQSPTLSYSGYYDSAELYKNTAKDENWTPSSGNDHTTQEFINKEGQVVLKRTFNNNQTHDTYYIYDDFGNLTYVLSPEASEQIISGNTLVTNHQEIMDKLGYHYKYDHRNRLIEKKVPAKGWEYIVYNTLDQPILTQDANQREKSPGEWLFIKYDAFGRVVYTGLRKQGGTRSGLQSAANNDDVQYEQRIASTSSPTTIAGVPVYYTNNATPGSIQELLTVNYYDEYIDTAGMSVPLTVYGINTTNDLQSLPTVSKVRVLGTDDWITTITGYDEKARPVYVQSNNPFLGTNDTVSSLLDFTGNVLESTSIHNKSGHSTITTVDYFTYDHQNRLLNHLQKINDEPLQLIASNEYDELGQLTRKKVGGILWEEGYTDISERLEVNQEGVITKISGGTSYNAGLSTIGALDGDGGLSFTMLTGDKVQLIGFNDSSGNSHHQEIDYSFRFAYHGGTRYRVRIKESGGENIYLTAVIPYEIGDNFAIERDGNELYFLHNGTIVTSYTMTQEYSTLIGDLSMRDVGASINNLNFYPTTPDNSLQKVDYDYNVRGWLTDINNISAVARGENDLFRFNINYDGDIIGDAGISGRAVPLYNGNISQTTWRTANTDRSKHTYGYKYDALNRIKQAYSRKGTNLTDYDHYNVSGISYDQNGNIISLIRQGDHNGNALTMDDLSYSYDGNQLLNVSDDGHISLKNEGFYDGNTLGNTLENDYSYDTNGNMTEDNNKGITSIVYNHLNLPTSITINGIDATGTAQNGQITYIYDASGIKLQKIVSDNNSTSPIPVTTSYAGGYIYESSVFPERLKLVPHPEGYIEPLDDIQAIGIFNTTTQIGSTAKFRYAFNYTDHLGNVRLTYSDSDGDGFVQQDEIISEKHYYPFGLQQKGYNNTVSANVNSVANRFGYGNKELGDELGLNWYDISARNYDPSIGRWFVVDALAEAPEQIFRSPYQYGWNNPVLYNDPDGNCPKCLIQAIKIGRKVYKAYKKVKKAGDKFTSKHLKDIGLDEVADLAGDFATIFSGDAGLLDRLGAVGDLVLGTDFNNKGQKAVKKALGFADDAKDASKTAKKADFVTTPDGKTVDVRLDSQGKKIKDDLNGGRNSVTVKTTDGQTRYDLDGKAHGGVETPHSQSYKKNTNPVTGQQNMSRTSKKAESMTQEELRAVRKTLEKRNKTSSGT